MAGAPFASAVLVSHALAQKDRSPYSQKPGSAYSDCPVGSELALADVGHTKVPERGVL